MVTLYMCVCCLNALETIYILAYANSVTNEVCNPVSQFWTREGAYQLSLHQWQVSINPTLRRHPLKIKSSRMLCYVYY